MANSGWKVIETELVINTKWMKVRRDHCLLPDGQEIPDYYYCENSDYSEVFAVTPERAVILVREYRHALRQSILQLPAGLISDQQEDPLCAAQRELAEETGFKSDDWHDLGTFSTSAKSTVRAHSFLALNARKFQEPVFDNSEHIETLIVSLPEILNCIDRGELHHASSVAACFVALRRLRAL